ncbi:MAG: FTR1 family protein [Desulfurococcales archaeon]|nr:FTR1 family protein [Desulfurococcales archaeon]
MSAFAASALVTFREAFEAALLLSIILIVLSRLGRKELRPYAYAATLVSILLGIGLGGGVYILYHGFPEKALFEAFSAYLAAVVLVTVIIWMARHGPNIKREVEEKLAKAFTPISVAIISFIFVFREVLETILITAPFLVQNPPATVAGVVVGTVGALILVSLIYLVGLKINLRLFFLATSIMLVFVASGLVGYGTHELLEWVEERGVELGVLGVKVYSLNIPESSLLHPNNLIGGVLSVLLGWYHYMELARFLAQFMFLSLGLFYVLRSYRLL